MNTPPACMSNTPAESIFDAVCFAVSPGSVVKCVPGASHTSARFNHAGNGLDKGWDFKGFGLGEQQVRVPLCTTVWPASRTKATGTQTQGPPSGSQSCCDQHCVQHAAWALPVVTRCSVHRPLPQSGALNSHCWVMLLPQLAGFFRS